MLHRLAATRARVLSKSLSHVSQNPEGVARREAQSVMVSAIETAAGASRRATRAQAGQRPVAHALLRQLRRRAPLLSGSQVRLPQIALK